MKSSAAAAAAPPLRLPSFPIPALQQLVTRHFRSTRAPELVVGGQRPLALVYLLVATLVAAPRRQTVVVVDAEARFDVRQLLGVQLVVSIDEAEAEVEAETETLSSPVTEDDLQHVHVFRVDPRWRVPLAELVAAAEQRVLYGAQRRRDRPWWGTVIVGGAGGGGVAGNPSASTGGTDNSNTLSRGVGAALVTGAYGWLRVARQEQDPFKSHKERQQQLLRLFEDVDLNKDDAEEATNAEMEEVEGKAEFEPVTWVASSPWGSFNFQLAKPASLPVQDNVEQVDDTVAST